MQEAARRAVRDYSRAGTVTGWPPRQPTTTSTAWSWTSPAGISGSKKSPSDCGASSAAERDRPAHRAHRTMTPSEPGAVRSIHELFSGPWGRRSTVYAARGMLAR